ncbi:hypothetical protein ACA910_008580 [Epithemia clementina (nom. ined.)]
MIGQYRRIRRLGENGKMEDVLSSDGSDTPRGNKISRRKGKKGSTSSKAGKSRTRKTATRRRDSNDSSIISSGGDDADTNAYGTTSGEEESVSDSSATQLTARRRNHTNSPTMPLVGTAFKAPPKLLQSPTNSDRDEDDNFARTALHHQLTLSDRHSLLPHEKPNSAVAATKPSHVSAKPRNTNPESKSKNDDKLRAAALTATTTTKKYDELGPASRSPFSSPIAVPLDTAASTTTTTSSSRKIPNNLPPKRDTVKGYSYTTSPLLSPVRNAKPQMSSVPRKTNRPLDDYEDEDHDFVMQPHKNVHKQETKKFHVGLTPTPTCKDLRGNGDNNDDSLNSRSLTESSSKSDSRSSLNSRRTNRSCDDGSRPLNDDYAMMQPTPAVKSHLIGRKSKGSLEDDNDYDNAVNGIRVVNGQIGSRASLSRPSQDIDAASHPHIGLVENNRTNNINQNGFGSPNAQAKNADPVPAKALRLLLSEDEDDRFTNRPLTGSSKITGESMSRSAATPVEVNESLVQRISAQRFDGGVDSIDGDGAVENQSKPLTSGGESTERAQLASIGALQAAATDLLPATRRTSSLAREWSNKMLLSLSQTNIGENLDAINPQQQQTNYLHQSLSGLETMEVQRRFPLPCEWQNPENLPANGMHYGPAVEAKIPYFAQQRISHRFSHHTTAAKASNSGARTTVFERHARHTKQQHEPPQSWPFPGVLMGRKPTKTLVVGICLYTCHKCRHRMTCRDGTVALRCPHCRNVLLPD